MYVYFEAFVHESHIHLLPLPTGEPDAGRGEDLIYPRLRQVCAKEPKKLTRVAAPSQRAGLGRRTVCGRTEQHRPPVSKRYETKVRMVWGSFLIAIAAAALKTPTEMVITPKASTSLS